MKRAHMIFRSALVVLAIATPAFSQDAAKPSRDEFFWLGQFNKAAVVMLLEQHVIDADLARAIADGVAKVIVAGDVPGARRPNVASYLQLEQQLIAVAGPDATRIHSGRSRQDLQATSNRTQVRERVLTVMADLITVRTRLRAISEKNVDTIIPSYTNGVQAQPITLAHYLLAFEAALSRDTERLRQSFARINLSPLGAAALGTSSFPISRPRLATLLGFYGPVENSYDANLVSSMDTLLEPLNIVEGSALTVSALVEDIVAQYRSVQPWLLLREGDLTGPSTIMPQKRNPFGLNVVRQTASTVVADTAAFVLQAHNVSPGMLDYKTGQPQKALDDATLMLVQLDKMLGTLVVNRDQALAEVNADYSTTTELADVLQREYNVPFRVGHGFASDLVTYGRNNHLTPAQLPYEEAQKAFAKALQDSKLPPRNFPMPDDQFHRVLTAQNMVKSSAGLGGPQPAEVERMLGTAQARLDADKQWLSDTRTALDKSETDLNSAFDRLRTH